MSVRQRTVIGTIQIAIGAFRLGDLTRYISESVILGFMSAAAALLTIGQIGTALGLRERGTGAQHLFHHLWLTLQGGPVNPRALAITAATLVLAAIARYCVNRFLLPRMDMLAVLIVVASAAYYFGWTAPIHQAAASRSIVQLGWFVQFAPDALAIAFLGLLEALAIAKSIALHTGQSLDFNRQCLAEGIANLVGGFEPQRLLYTMRASRQDAAVLLVTIVTALAFGLDIAIFVGVALSILLYVSRASRLKCVELVVDSDGVVRVRHPDAVCLARLDFFAWYPQDQVYAQGKDEDSATLAAIRRVYGELAAVSSGTLEQPAVNWVMNGSVLMRDGHHGLPQRAGTLGVPCRFPCSTLSAA